MVTNVQRIAGVNNDVRNKDSKTWKFLVKYASSSGKPRVNEKEEQQGRQREQNGKYGLNKKLAAIYQDKSREQLQEDRKGRILVLMEEMNDIFRREQGCYLKIGELRRKNGVGSHSMEQRQLDVLKKMMDGENVTKDEMDLYRSMGELSSYQKQVLQYLKAARYWKAEFARLEEIVKDEMPAAFVQPGKEQGEFELVGLRDIFEQYDERIKDAFIEAIGEAVGMPGREMDEEILKGLYMDNEA